MLFVLDIGNTNMVAGLYASSELIHTWRFATDLKKTADEYLVLLRDFLKQAGVPPEAVKDSILASVVPPLAAVLEEAFRRLFSRRPLIVSARLDLGCRVRTDRPSEVGADRLVNAVAGYRLYGGPLIIVDLGTATTVDAVSRRGDYLGGLIAPGVGISMEALIARTAKLPRIEMRKPLKTVGTSTVESMRSGMYHGAIGQIREMIAAVRETLGRKTRVIATGGWANWIPSKKLGVHAVAPDLTLEGLRLIWERNAARGRKSARSRRPR